MWPKCGCMCAYGQSCAPSWGHVAEVVAEVGGRVAEVVAEVGGRVAEVVAKVGDKYLRIDCFENGKIAFLRKSVMRKICAFTNDSGLLFVSSRRLFSLEFWPFY